MSAVQTPYCIAMVLCEAAHRCGITNKHTLVGTFQRLHSKTNPPKAAFSVYVALTDGLGTIPLQFQIVDSTDGLVDNEEETVLVNLAFEVKFPNPLAIAEAVFNLKIEFPRPGTYVCRLRSAEGDIMLRRIMIAAPPNQPPSGEP